MFTITDLAVEKVKEILQEEGKSTWGLRIYTMEGGCCGPSFGLDIEENPSQDDEIIEKNGLRIFMDKNTSMRLSNMKMDFYDDGERQGFVLTGGSQPSCGSGCSSCS